MKRVLYIVVLLAVAGAFYAYAYPRLAGVGAADAQQTATTAAGKSGRGAGGKGGPGAGGFAIGVVSAVAQKQTVPITKSAVGYVEAVNTVVLRSRADGTIVQQEVTEGQNVKAGDVLFKLDDSALQATVAKDQAQIAKDQANEAEAQAALKREQDLFSKGVDPQSSLDADVAAAKAAQATVVVDQAQLRADQVSLSYMTIKSPIDGRVGTVNTSVGNVVHASDTSAGGLLTITQMSPLRVSFSIAEADLDTFRNALAKAKALDVEISAPDDKTPRASGKLTFIDSSVDTGSGTIVLKADIDNSANTLWPGQYVTAVTQLGAYEDATTVPLVAVQQSDSGPYVFAVGTDDKVKKQPVVVTASVGDIAVIASGVKPGDHVVTEGQLRLANGTAVRETLSGQTAKVASRGKGNPSSDGASGGAPPATPASNS